MEITELYLLFRSKKAWYSILLSPSRGIPRRRPDFSGINGYFTFRYQFRTSLLPTYANIQYRDVKYPLIPEKPGIRRGIPREGDIVVLKIQ
jgi:hypothetical protein